MKVLIYGSGAREHALAWKISQSPLLEKLYLAKPNDGFSSLGEKIESDTIDGLAKKASQNNIDLLIVGPENPLNEGIVDLFQKHKIACIGANRDWAQLESSKSFAKEFMTRNKIPTARYQTIIKKNELKIEPPMAIKADGLCAGKGVSIAYSKEEANQTIESYLNGEFGSASEKIVIEEFLEGEELSLISLWDGETLLPLIPAKDFKKLKNNNQGVNTGGMAAFCPVNLSEKQKTNLEFYCEKLQYALLKEKADFKGVIYSGLIWNKNEFKVLEFNMRFGDPEAQVLMMHLESDLLEIFKLCIEKKLSTAKLKWKQSDTYSGCLTIATKGYPDSYKKNIPIKNLPKDTNIFFAGVKKNPKLVSSGGRVLSLCKTGKNPYNVIYQAAKKLDFKEKYYRTDIKID